MRRRISTLASGLSLILFATSVVFGVRSYRVADVWSAERFRSYGVASWRGALEFLVVDRSDYVDRLASRGTYRRTYISAGFSRGWHFTHDVSDGRSFDDDRFRFRFGEVSDVSNGDVIEHEGSVTRWSYVRLPHWCAAALCLFLPGMWARGALRRHRRKSRGLCGRCGYDLRASPDRCPECGAPVHIPATAE